MDVQNKAMLDQILSAFDAQRAASTQEAERIKTEHQAFLEAFAQKSRSVIRPSMEEVAHRLRAYGHDAAIVEQPESRDDRGRTRNARIILTIFPFKMKPRSSEHDCPHVAVMVDSSTNSVYVHESTMMPGRGGSAGVNGEYQLEQVSAEVVEGHILRVLSRAMGG